MIRSFARTFVLMRETFTNISAGLVVAVVVIFLLLAANF